MTALTVAAGGNVTGGAGQFAQGATIAYMQKLGANQVKQIADSLDSDSACGALHAIVGCAGAAAGSQGCGARAMGAAASSVIGSLLGPTTNMSAADREARENLVNGLVAGIATASGVNAATATGAARIEVENTRMEARLRGMGRWAKEFVAPMASTSGQTPPADADPLVDAATVNKLLNDPSFNAAMQKGPDKYLG
jgi:filamentous hemagglutinin